MEFQIIIGIFCYGEWIITNDFLLGKFKDLPKSNTRESSINTPPRDMINAGNNVGNGCKTIGYFSHNIRSRQTESVHTNIFDIQASIKWKMITRLGQLGRDTTLKLNVSQLVFN